MNEGSFLRTEPLIRPAGEALPPPAPTYGSASSYAPVSTGPAGVDQLARIEDKAARIEDKFARTETLLLRMQATFEDAMGEFGGLARRTDVTAIQKRVRHLPGFGGLLFAAVLAGVVGAALTLGALKFGIVTIEPK